MHQLNNGFDVIELPHPSVKDLDSDLLFKGEMDLASLGQQLKINKNEVAMVGLEVLCNASGGHPVRLSHIYKLKSILEGEGIPLVLDASRIIRNAFLIKHFEEKYVERPIWEIVSQTAGQADYIVTSLTKDFAVPMGGLIATNDDKLAAKIKSIQESSGRMVPQDVEDMIIKAFSEKEASINLIGRQLNFSRRIQDMLLEANVPILKPAYGHAVVMDVSKFADGETNTQMKENFLNELFVETGIRAGVHQVGKQKNTILDQCIRVAFPLGIKEEDEQVIYSKLQEFFTGKQNNSEKCAN